MSPAVRALALLLCLCSILANVPISGPAPSSAEECCQDQCCCQEVLAEGSCCSDDAESGVRFVDACGCGTRHEPGGVAHRTHPMSLELYALRIARAGPRLARSADVVSSVASWRRTPEPPVPRLAG